MKNEEENRKVSAVEVVMSGIKCDNPSCDHFEKDVPFENYSEYVDKPCPKCGENLLTQEDFESANRMMDLGELLKGIGDLMYPEGINPEDGTMLHGEIQSDTKGGLSINFPCEDEED